MANVYTPVDSSFKLVLDDEFNGNSLNTNIWSPGWFLQGGSGLSGPVNTAETAVYNSNLVSVSGGDLHLGLITSPTTFNGKTYQYQGSLVQENGWKFSYGYFEARVYMPPASPGVIANWPIWWLDGQNWPTDGEIDIAEGEQGKAWSTFHNPAGAQGQQASGDFTGWHVFGANWEPGKIDFYYDGKLVHTVTSGVTSSPEQMIFDNGIGQWGGPLLTPTDMMVDYVHVYQNNPNAVAVTPQAGYGGPGDTGGTVTPPPPPPPPPPQPPVANADTATTVENQQVVIKVLANDTDSSGTISPSSVAITTAAAHGTTSIDPNTGAVTYTPASGFVGSDTFLYTVADTKGDVSSPAAVSVNVAASPPPPPPPQQPSPDGTQITSPTDSPIIDQLGNSWSLVQSATMGLQIAVNRVVDQATHNVALLETLSGSMVQENSAGQWYSESQPNDSWVQIANPTPTPPPPTTTGTLALAISEDYYKGDANFTVSVDGKQVGGTQTAHALHSTGADEVLLLTGNWGPTVQHDVKISFINDAYAGAKSTDRNLYVDSIALNGKTYSGTSAALMSNGSHDFSVGGTVPTQTAAPDTLTLHLSEDAWNGDAQFQVSIDGKTLDTKEVVTALHSANTSQDFIYTGTFGPGTHNVGVTFLNDAYGKTASTDRNLYVGSVTYDSHTYTGATLFSAGTAHFSVSA